MSICPHKHTKYQPTDEEWRCPKCGATAQEGFIIYESINDMDNIECELLHPEDYLHCEKCGLDTSGKAFAAFVVKKNSLTTCPTCKGKGMVNRDFTAAHASEVERLTAGRDAAVRERDAAVEALRGLVSSVDALVSDSYGVVGLHLNGDVAPWDELLQGGRYEEWLAALEDARAILAGHAPATPQQVTPHRTTLLDQLETGPWPSFVRDVKAISETPATKGEGDE